MRAASDSGTWAASSPSTASFRPYSYGGDGSRGGKERWGEGGKKGKNKGSRKAARPESAKDTAASTGTQLNITLVSSPDPVVQKKDIPVSSGRYSLRTAPKGKGKLQALLTPTEGFRSETQSAWVNPPVTVKFGDTELAKLRKGSAALTLNVTDTPWKL